MSSSYINNRIALKILCSDDYKNRSQRAIYRIEDLKKEFSFENLKEILKKEYQEKPLKNNIRSSSHDSIKENLRYNIFEDNSNNNVCNNSFNNIIIDNDKTNNNVIRLNNINNNLEMNNNNLVDKTKMILRIYKRNEGNKKDFEDEKKNDSLKHFYNKNLNNSTDFKNKSIIIEEEKESEENFERIDDKKDILSPKNNSQHIRDNNYIRNLKSFLSQEVENNNLSQSIFLKEEMKKIHDSIINDTKNHNEKIRKNNLSRNLSSLYKNRNAYTNKKKNLKKMIYNVINKNKNENEYSKFNFIFTPKKEINKNLFFDNFVENNKKKQYKGINFKNILIKNKEKINNNTISPQKKNNSNLFDYKKLSMGDNNNQRKIKIKFKSNSTSNINNSHLYKK